MRPLPGEELPNAGRGEGLAALLGCEGLEGHVDREGNGGLLLLSGHSDDSFCPYISETN